MQSNIKKIGNSQGVIIPPAFLSQLGLEKGSPIEIQFSSDGILIKPSHEVNARADWELQFKEALSEGQEPESDYFNGMNTKFDDEEWTW